MNIFKILANGDGSINEPNVSAFLGYLLDPYQDHGLGFVFLKKFIDLILEEYDDKLIECDFEILLEQAFRSEDPTITKKEIVDIVVLCFNNSKGNFKEIVAKTYMESKRELYKIILIENKLNRSAYKDNQVKNQFLSTIDTLKINEEKIISVYLTPEMDIYKKSYLETINNSEFQKRKLNLNHIFWKSEIEENCSTILKLLREVIEEESKGQIEAINEYTRHTLISFAKFIESNFTSEIQEKKNRKNDGSYTAGYVKKNEESKIFEVLENLKLELEKYPDGFFKDKITIIRNRPQWPALSIDFNNFLIEVGAGYVPRGKCTLAYRVNPKIFEVSKLKMHEIEKKLNITLKKANTKDIYCRTNEMQNTKFDLLDFNGINKAIRDAHINVF